MGPEEQVNDFFPADGETMSEQVVRWVAQVCGRSLGEGEEARRAMLAVLPFACPVERPLRMPVQPLETLVEGLLQPMPLLQPVR